jgi:hypothetical protein
MGDSPEKVYTATGGSVSRARTNPELLKTLNQGVERRPLVLARLIDIHAGKLQSFVNRSRFNQSMVRCGYGT